jgi:titin
MGDTMGKGSGNPQQRRRARQCVPLLALAVAGALGCGAAAADGVPATVFTVTTTQADGAGSLAQAITRANQSAGPTQIAFALTQADPGFAATTGVWTLRLAVPLPALTGGPVTIDGTTQPAAPNPQPGRTPRLAIVAAAAGVEQAFSVVSAGHTLRGLAIGGFRYGVVLYGRGATANTLTECHLGIDATGVAAQPNQTGVIIVEGAHGNTLNRNVISGNTQIGVYIGGQESIQNQLQGNHIGCNADGSRRLANGLGIMISRAPENVIGGTAAGAGNLISGNDDIGILLVGKWTERNLILGNSIGTDHAGERPLSNNIGIVLKALANQNTIGGAAAGAGNLVSGNREIGIYIEAADGNRILGNLIGTDRSGRRTVQDGDLVQGNGVEFNTVAKNNVLGGLGAGERNVISGHKVYGVVYYGHCERNSTLGNYIGVDSSGAGALPNATGICVDCASHHNDIAGNVISGNLSYGLFFVTRGTEYNTLRSNRIGVDVSGTLAVPNDIGMVISTGASHNRVGGTDPADRNLISGNRQSGLMITNRFTEHNQVIGNYIGVDASGAKGLGNLHGVLLATYPQANLVRDNVIAANRSAGVILYEYAEANEVLANRIGTDATGKLALGNQAGGVVVDQQARANRVHGNLIAHNLGGSIIVGKDAGPGNLLGGNETP